MSLSGESDSWAADVAILKAYKAVQLAKSRVMASDPAWPHLVQAAREILLAGEKHMVLDRSDNDG